jgi:hypothetical protein
VIVRSAELEGALLDAAVAKAEGHLLSRSEQYGLEVIDAATNRLVANTDYSSDWACGGPIIERERIAVLMLDNKWRAWTPEHHGYDPRYWLFERTSRSAEGTGPTPLIAAMRAYVASKFGEEVELPA